MDTWSQDLRYALRGLARSKGLTAVAIVCLAVGIGANTAIFSVVQSVLLTPLPFGEPEGIIRIWGSKPDRGWDRTSFTHANFFDFRDLVTAFEDIGAYRPTTLNLTGFDYPEQLGGARISAGFFRILRVEPVLGRTFQPNEDQIDGEYRVALLSNRLWQTRFGADPEIIGTSLALDGVDTEVVGVLPAGEPWLDAADIFVPLVETPDANRGSFELAVIGRMNYGVTMEVARADLERVAAMLEQQYPEVNDGLGVAVGPSSDWIADDNLRTALWVLMGAVGFLLMIACVNLANLLLARATGKTRETALRNALGADRRRIIRQVLTESLVLGLIGAVVGVLLASFMIDLLRAFDPGGIPRIHEMGINGSVLGFTLITALATGVISGMAPALQTSSANLAMVLREGDRGVAGNKRQRRVRGALVVVEVALSLMLLVGAGLLIRSFGELLRVDRGFETGNRLIFEVNLPIPPDGSNPVDRLLQEFLPRIDALPQVESVGAVSMRPISGGNAGMGIVPAGRVEDPDQTVPWAGWRMISPGYFRAMGVPLLQGRGFTEQDVIGDPWRVVISERLAELLWPGEAPIGRQAILWRGQNDFPAEVIGVAGNMRERGLSDDPTLVVYMPYNGGGWNPVNFVVHTTGDAAAVTPVVRTIMSDIDPDLPIANVESMEELVDGSLSGSRFNTLLFGVFAAVALLLALAGVFGVLAYSVRQRTAEIGVRLALGAGSGEILGLVMLQGMRPVFIGVGLGLIGSVALSRFLSSMLFGITPGDPITYVTVAALLTGAAAVACYLPALRAVRIDPLLALRDE